MGQGRRIAGWLPEPQNPAWHYDGNHV